MKKKRRFPKNLTIRGECCIVWDRKFYIHELFKEFRTKLANVNDHVKANKDIIKTKTRIIEEYDRKIQRIVENKKSN